MSKLNKHYKKIIAKRILKKMKEVNMIRNDLSRLSGLSISAVCQMLDGKYNYSGLTIGNILKIQNELQKYDLSFTHNDILERLVD